MAMFVTPTQGLGCRSASYLLYGAISTLVWLFCVLSSVLAHCYKSIKKGTATSTFIWGASLALRHTAKLAAAGNAVWMFPTAILKYSNLYDTCWCKSNKFALGSRAYTVITYPDPVLNRIKLAWAAGLVLSFFTAALFLIALNVLRKRPAKEPDSIQLHWTEPENDH